ncbi:putative multidrug resistance-associated protein [Truncatella angustata]|uniref:Multidrug resistance-associated protein n=1 Tax=Truncatella angustata TaxID=152316 RepID=A0A9P8UE32_9PEZI|nr:putative multidrug resistance-associated protein [Truncatella angustata]KAH6648221.1 putative multidrug resistance-associated protein [Truncatella angustata]
MSCDRAFGPRVASSCRAFDFTLYFEDAVFAVLPTAALLLFLPLSLVLSSRNPKVVKRSKLLAVKLVTYLCLLACQAVFLALRRVDPGLRTQASLAADVIGTAGAIGVALLSWFDHQRSIRPSSLLAMYLMIATILGVARLRTLWSIPGATGAAIVFSLVLGLTLTALVLESTSKDQALRSPREYSGVGSEPFSGLWARIAYFWLLGTVRQGYHKILSVDDLPGMDPQLRSGVLHSKLEREWSACDQARKYSLIVSCFRAYSTALFSAVLPRLCLTGFTFAQPFMINTLTDWIQKTDAPESSGKGMIGAYALVYLGLASATAFYWYQTFRFITRVRAGLISLVYQQTVQARAIDLGDTTGLTLMGTDVDRIVLAFRSLHEVWASLLEMFLAIYLLERQLGVPCVMPGVLTLAFTLTTFKLSSIGKTSQKRWIERVEKRLSVISSMLGDIKAVKMLGLTDKMFDIIDRLQRIEIETSMRFRKIFIAQVFFSNAPAALAPIVTFALYVGISNAKNDNTLLASRAFTSLSLISLLTASALTFIQSIPSMIQCFACFERIQEYCRQPISPFAAQEHFPTHSKLSCEKKQIQLHPLEMANDSKSSSPLISFSDQSFSWSNAGPAILKCLNLEIQPRKITVIVGPTGSGKSTLLQSIIGETIALGGQTNRNFSTAAYCSQTPWLTNGTIRDNIIGASPLDEVWYASVLHACALEDDIARLTRGDRTKVGSNGVNLSGGQRQRVSMARAVYSRCRLVLLDDTFSGLDSHTVELTAGRLFGPEGLFVRNQTTVIIATHSSAVLAFADIVVVLENGSVVKAGKAQAPEQAVKEDLAISNMDSTNESAQSNESGSLRGSGSTQAAQADSPLGQDAADMTDLKRRQGDWSVYSYYFKAAGKYELAFFLAFMSLWTVCEQFSAVWLNWWSDANEVATNRRDGMYLGVYAGLGVAASVFMGAACWFLFINIITKSSRTFHRALLLATLRAPLYFFYETDLGSITNRFSQDMELIGLDFPLIAVNYVSAACNCIAQVLILGIFTKYLAVTVPFVLALVVIIQRFYLRTSRQVRLLDIEAKAPVYLHFIETASGTATIRAFGWQHYFRRTLEVALDRSQRPVYLLFSVQRWLALVLDLVVSVLVIILVSIVVTWKSSFDSGAVGLSLVIVMMFNKTLMSVVQYWTSLETSVGAVARIKQYVELTKSEDRSDRIPQTIPQNWPSSGAIKFSNLVASHAPDGLPVLKDISLDVKAGDRVAICGRSGGGKTSLVLSVLQMTSIQRGSVEIDGIEISSLAPVELRQCINVVPQDPVLMPGSVRFNLDPYGSASEDEIIKALGELRLWSRIEALGGLESELDNASWSAGERQLLCLARAMVRKSRLLLLDEATSSVDPQTEVLMQDVIATGFPNCTVLSVMHRLNTIRRFDKVIVLHEGEIVEYDEPNTLLAKESRLLEMYKAGGYQ